MSQSSRTFRIFVSSTFSDLKAERNALQEKVFPRLRDLAAAHGCRFQAIDLRWGVSEEAALDQQTMKICLGEIERCQKTSRRPNFIALLGDRYGWRPIPSEIPASEFEQILPLVSKESKDLLEWWYRRDDNAIPPSYCLQPRSGEFVEYAVWENIENSLRQAFVTTIEKLAFPPDAALKYIASATEQEIVAGALKVADAKEHVFCFLRDIQGLPVDGSAASFRETDPQAAQKQAELKDRVRQQLSNNIHEYTAHWQGDGPSQDHLDQLCEDVYSELSKVILAEVKELKTVEPLDREIEAHEVFGKERAHIFIARADILNSIEKYIAGSDPRPLAIWGVSGCGKSALMAKAVEQAQKTGQDVLYRFIGVTPESSNGRALLESMCRQISRRYGANEFTIPSEYNDLVQEFPKRLALAKPDKPLIIFLDALDQLSDSDNACNLTWLPVDLPPNVQLVVSTLLGECLQVLESKLPVENRLEVQPMSVEEGKNILTEWLSGANRQLQKKQEEHLLDKFQQCGLPLYLKLAFEEARLWKSYDALPELSGDIPGILRDLFKRLSLESNHGGMLVSRNLGYLAAGKNGLSEDELLDVLSLDKEMLADFQRRSPKSPISDRLPVVIWSRLYFDLEPYLAERSADGASLLGFYHRQMSEACQAAYREPARHAGLAAYFTSQPLYLDKDKQAPDLRKTSEQVYQQRHGEMWEELSTTLTDFDFLEGRCRAASVYDLEGDYRLALQGWQGKDKNIIEAFEDRLHLESHVINKTPELLFSQFYNYLTWLDAPDGPIHRICETEGKKHHGWLRMTQDSRPASPLLDSLELEGPGCVEVVAVTPDGKKIVSATSFDKTIKVWDLQSGHLIYSLEGHTLPVYAVAVTPDGKQVVSGSDDKTIKVWDLGTGRLLRSLEEHTQFVKAVAVTPDGKQIISGSYDKTIKVWDLGTGRLLRSLERHKDCVTAVAVTPDGKQIVSGSRDQTIKVWDLQTGSLLRSLERQTDEAWAEEYAVAVTPDGAQIVSASGITIKVWDLASGHLLRSMEWGGFAMAVTPNGKQVVFPYGLFIKVWDLETDCLLSSLEGHASWVNAVAVTPDGVHVVSGSSRDKTIKVWDLQSGCLLRSLERRTDGAQGVSGSGDSTLNVRDLQQSNHVVRSLEGHKYSVSAVAVTPDGKQIVSGSWDKTIKVWDPQNGLLLRSLEGHTNPVVTVAVTPDGKQVVSGSGIKNLSKELSASGFSVPTLEYNTIKVWDLEGGSLLCSMTGHKKGGVSAVAVTPDSKKVISGSDDKTIKVWDLKSGSLLRSLEGHTKCVLSVAVTPDGAQIVSGSEDMTIKIWDLGTGHPLRSLAGETLFLNAVAVTPDGKQVISGSGSSYYYLSSRHNIIQVWNLETGRLLHCMEGQAGGVKVVAILPDSKQVVFGSDDNTIKVWQLGSREVSRTLFQNSSPIECLATDGHWLVCGDTEGHVWIFEWMH